MLVSYLVHELIQVTEMLLCADTVPESVLRRAVEVVASQCYTKVSISMVQYGTAAVFELLCYRKLDSTRVLMF